MMALSFLGRRTLLGRRLHLPTVRNNGYIVLVPEIGEDLPEKNPLLQNDGLPAFNNISIEQCMAAVAKQTLELESCVQEIETSIKEKQPSNIFKDVFQVLEEVGAPLDLTWGLAKTLYLGNSSLMPTKSYLAIHDRAKRARATKFNSIPIYQCVKAELQKEKNYHTEEETRILKKFALEGKLNGLELLDSSKIGLKQILSKLTTERSQFRQKVDICSKQFSHVITDISIVRDFPPNILTAIAQNPVKYMEGPWKITLEPNVYMPVMENCPEREIRWNIWQALVNRGSGYGDRDLATGIHLEEIRYARQDLAKLLGFVSYADMSMETKMAGSVANVNNMLNTLLERAKPAQDIELQNMYEFALERGFKGTRIELWDVPYWRTKQLNSLFNFKEEKFQEYFPLHTVLKGLFKLCENLFNIVIKQRNNIASWHKDVQFYDIFDHHTSAPIAGFYIDPYARSDEKIKVQSNGWMVGIQNQSKVTDTKPLAALIFNFESPVEKNPPHLTFKEVKHLFHKFGLALQHLLTSTNYSEVSGSSNIEWDAVEVSGHVLAHWLYNENVINAISCHRETGEQLPSEMFESIIKVHKHSAGIDLSRELYLAALDLELHHSKDYWLDVVKKLWPQFRSFPLDKLDSHPCSFTQIFIEEWAAAYYSHVWSKMVAADVYSAFHEVQGDEQKIQEVGKRFRNTFLTLGGSCHPSKIFRKFRGRDPSPNALLSSLGLKRNKTEQQ